MRRWQKHLSRINKIKEKVLSCYWSVYINGKEVLLPVKNCIESIDIDEKSSGSDTCTLSIRDKDLTFINEDIFAKQSKVKVVIGWNEDTYRSTFSGYISAIDVDFGEDGIPKLSIFCLDKTHLMNTKKKRRSWDNVSRADVIEKIAKEYGFNFKKESGYKFKVEENIAQSGQTDIEFIESLAKKERDPFLCKLVGDTFYYVKKKVTKKEKDSFVYRQFPYDIVSFKPRVNKETVREEVGKGDIRSVDKKVDSAVANNNNTQRDTKNPVVNSSRATVMKFSPKTRSWSKVRK